MRHSTLTQSFSRPHNQRMWLMRNLVISMVEHERIRTTTAKAKELRKWVEKAITLGKKGSLSNRRLLLSRIPHKPTVEKVFKDLAVRFKDRNGGYTRIYKMVPRPGDNAEMALIEFLDANLKKVSKATKDNADKAKKKLASGKGAEGAAESGSKKKKSKAVSEKSESKKKESKAE